MYQVEFVNWIDGGHEPQVLSRLDEVFATEKEAFERASASMPDLQRQGATAFRIFDQNEKPASLPQVAFTEAKGE